MNTQNGSQSLHNRLCWPLDDFVAKTFLSYNYKKNMRPHQGVQNVCVY